MNEPFVDQSAAWEESQEVQDDYQALLRDITELGETIESFYQEFTRDISRLAAELSLLTGDADALRRDTTRLEYEAQVDDNPVMIGRGFDAPAVIYNVERQGASSSGVVLRDKTLEQVRRWVARQKSPSYVIVQYTTYREVIE